MKKNIFLILDRTYEGKQLNLEKKQKIKICSAEIIWSKYLFFIFKYKIVFLIPLLIMRGTKFWVIWAKIPWKKNIYFYKNILFDLKGFKFIYNNVANWEMKDYSSAFLLRSTLKSKIFKNTGNYYIRPSIKNLYIYSLYLKNIKTLGIN